MGSKEIKTKTVLAVFLESREKKTIELKNKVKVIQGLVALFEIPCTVYRLCLAIAASGLLCSLKAFQKASEDPSYEVNRKSI